MAGLGTAALQLAGCSLNKKGAAQQALMNQVGLLAERDV